MTETHEDFEMRSKEPTELVEGAFLGNLLGLHLDRRKDVRILLGPFQ